MLVLFLGWIAYFQFQDSEDLKKHREYVVAKQNVDEINEALDSMKQGSIGTIPDWVPRNFTPEQKERILRFSLLNNEDAMKLNKQYANKERNVNWKQLDAIGVNWTVPTFGSIGAFLFLWGFRRWQTKIQRPNDILLEIDIKIKELSLRKAELELAEDVVALEVRVRAAVLKKCELEIEQIKKGMRLARRR